MKTREEMEWEDSEEFFQQEKKINEEVWAMIEARKLREQRNQVSGQGPSISIELVRPVEYGVASDLEHMAEVQKVIERIEKQQSYFHAEYKDGMITLTPKEVSVSVVAADDECEEDEEEEEALCSEKWGIVYY
jgi:hypothetical protein